MKNEEIAVYSLCRISPKGDIEHYRREAKSKCWQNLHPDEENIHLYVDEVIIGEKSERTELNRMFQDTIDGKFDRIIISDVLDLWHSPQKILDTLQTINQSKKAVTILSFPPSDYWQMYYPASHDGYEGQLIYQSLQAYTMVNELQFLYDNYDLLSKEMRNKIIAQNIDPDMFEQYLIQYYLEPRDMEIENFADSIGIKSNNIDVIKECWCPSIKLQDLIIEMFGKEFIAYYLA